jgi:acid phosphatase type 7
MPSMLSLAIALLLAVIGCGGSAPSRPPREGSQAGEVEVAKANRPTVVAAGDISCEGVCGQAVTARLVRNIDPDAVLGLGDFQYDTGTRERFNRYYDRFWGPFKSKTYPINGGSHDFYGTGDYLDYFNDGGPLRLRPEASYSFDVGRWHLVALNSYCFERGSCDDAAWTRWLVRDLRRNKRRCTLAYWHEPYWTSPSHHERQTDLTPWVRVLYHAGVDVLLQAHNHAYERFAPQDPGGARDDRHGIRAFTVGTGGRSLYDYHGTARNSVTKEDTTYGVLRLRLRPNAYDWRFVPAPGSHFADAGRSKCH